MPPIEAVIAENEQLRGELAQRDLAIAALQKQLQWLQQKVFGGGKSEKLDEAQLRLKLDELEKVAAAEPTQTVTYERSSRRAKPTEAPAERFKDLPIEETVVIEPEEVKAAPQDFEEISREETFEVDVHPPRLFKRLIVRPKYRHRIDRTRAPVIAPAPARPIEGGYASAGLLAWIVLSKYLEHQPLYRQEKMSARWGAALSRKTMADWVETVAFWLKPLYNHMRLNLLAGDYLQADETPVRYHDPDQKKAKTEQDWLWVISRPGGDVVFDWRLTRRHGEVTSLLEGYRGLLQSDGYDAYGRHAQQEDLVWIGCWAHARRKFVEALKNHRREAGLVLSLIGRLYGHERRYREEALTPAQRQSRRIQDQTNTIRRLRRVLGILAPGALPKSDLGKACHYTLGHWPQLVQYLHTAKSRSTTTSSKTRSAPAPWGRRTGSSLAIPTSANAQPSSTPSSSAANATVSIHWPTCATFSHACRR